MWGTGLIHRVVAGLLLWPMDLVDFLAPDMTDIPYSDRARRGIGCFMAVWYVVLIYTIVSLLSCLT